jgi:hypothetical protein
MSSPRGSSGAGARLVTLEVVEREGPIVEIVFHRPIASPEDVDELLREASDFMVRQVLPSGARKAYFLTCYDGFAVAKDLARSLQDAFLRFNEQYSLGDARYGGAVVAQSLVIATAIRSESASELYSTRKGALRSLKARMAGRGASG